MQYKKIEKENIIRNKKRNINSETEVHKKYSNPEYKFDIQNYTHISYYNGIEKHKNVTLYNVIITEKQKEILENNKGKDNHITTSHNALPVKATLLSYEVKKKNNTYYADLNIHMIEGKIIPKGIYKITFKESFIEIQNSMFKNNEYYENWGYSIYFFDLKEITKIFLSFKTGIIDSQIDKNNDFLNHSNGCVYLFESSRIKSQINENIQDLIINNKYISKFEISEANKIIHHEYLFNAKEKEYLIIQAHKFNNKGNCIKSLISDLTVSYYNPDEMKYLYEPRDQNLERMVNYTTNTFIFILGIIFAKYYYNLYNNRKIKRLEKEYNKLESAYKFILKDKYNL